MQSHMSSCCLSVNSVLRDFASLQWQQRGDEGKFFYRLIIILQKSGETVVDGNKHHQGFSSFEFFFGVGLHTCSIHVSAQVTTQ